MTKTVYKFPLSMATYQSIALPVDAEVLTVQVQGTSVCLWAKIDPTLRRYPHGIAIHGTGHEFNDDNYRYITTFQLNEALVFHVFLIEQPYPMTLTADA